MMFGLLRKTKRKMMVVEAFVLFFPVTLELNGGRYNIAVLGDRHAERILMISCLTVICLFLEVLIQFPCSLRLIRWS